MSDYVLKHHGIKGQKWGVRRYQNPDGTLTDAGKKHLQKVQDDASKLSRTHARLEDVTRTYEKKTNGGQTKLLVSPEEKQAYRDLMNEYVTTHQVMSKKYKDVTNTIIRENGEDYIYSLLVDPKTGWGAESKVKLHQQ